MPTTTLDYGNSSRDGFGFPRLTKEDPTIPDTAKQKLTRTKKTADKEDRGQVSREEATMSELSEDRQQANGTIQRNQRG